MRLKKNRSEFNDLLRRHEGSVDAEGNRDEGVIEGSYADWAGTDEQSLLDVVGAVQLAKEEADQAQRQIEGDAAGPSGLGKADEGMREVFGLGDVGVE